MTKKLLSPTKMMAGLTILATILGTTKESLAQNLASNNNKTQSSINTVGSTSPTDFAVANVGKYYPDMVDYTKKMMNSFISDNQKDFVNKTLAELIKKYPNDKDKIKFIIGTLEGNVFMNGANFSDKYRTDPTDLDFDIDEAFNQAYDRRFNTNLANLQNKIKILEQSIQAKEQSIQAKEQTLKDLNKIYEQQINDIMKLLDSFSIEDIKNNSMVFEAVKKTKENAKKLGRKTTPHIEQLFSTIK